MSDEENIMNVRWGPTVNLAGATAAIVSSNKGHVYFYTDVTVPNIAELQKSLQEAEETSLTLAAIEGSAPKPIKLHIHSYGGNLFAGLAGMEAIRNCRVGVHTFVEGGAASAATLLSVFGTKRFITEHSYILIHQLSWGIKGKYNELKDGVANADELMKIIRKVYQEKTKIKLEKLD